MHTMATKQIETPKRPIIRYHGGKWRLARWIISYFPRHRCYIEPYCGSASVLMQKDRCYAEILNDLDGEIVNVFRVLQDDAATDELCQLLINTPYARDEFLLAYKRHENPVEQARRTIIKSFMGFSSSSIHDPHPAEMQMGWNAPTGFRSNSSRRGTTPAHDWMHYPAQLTNFRNRLRGVVIENTSALQCIRAHDSPDSLHYIDPPYVAITRDKGTDYAFEMSDGDHCELAEVLHSIKGMAILSGYPSDLYARLYGDWRCFTKTHAASGARKRIECLWLNPRAADQTLTLDFDHLEVS